MSHAAAVRQLPAERGTDASPGGTQLELAALGTPLIDTTFVVLDLETTGLSPATDRITEVGAVKVRGGTVLGELRSFVHPGRAIPPAVTAVTGITDAMVRDAPTVAAVLPTVLRFLGDAVLVAHNASFDVAFLRAASARGGFGDFEPVVVDTARLSRRLLRGEVRDCRLRTVARHLRARTAPEHRALADARATVDVLHGLIERAGSYGATTLDDLRDLARSTSDRAYRRIGLVREAPATCGVYRFLDDHGDVLYVGKATNLRTRLRGYFGQDRRRRIADLVRETDRVDWTTTPTLLEAEVRELRDIHRHQPRYNRRSKRRPTSVYVAITREPFPRLSIVRVPGRAHLRTIGPLASRRTAQCLVEALQTATAIRSCRDRLRLAQDHTACILAELGRCGAPCDGSQSRRDYADVVARLDAILDDPTELLDDLRRRMRERARQGRFERATELRGQLHTTARALHRLREAASLTAVEELVVAHRTADATDVMLIRRGGLAASARLEHAASDEAILDRLRHVDGPSPGDACGHPDTAEIELVLAWLSGPDRRLVHARGGYAVPSAGGAALASTVAESRRLSRELRRDHQLLGGVKVARRADRAV